MKITRIDSMMEVQINGKKYNFPNDVIAMEKRIVELEKILASAKSNIGILDNWFCELKERVEKLEKLNI